MSLKGIYRGMS